MKESFIDEHIFDIDQNLLDVEWVNQPKLFFKYAEELAEAEGRLDCAERDLKALDADIDSIIRAREEKVTEALVKSKILGDKKHQAQEELIAKRRRKVGLLRAVVQSLDQRKRALEKLVDLHGQQYFATPKASERSKDFKEKIENRAFISKDRKKKDND